MKYIKQLSIILLVSLIGEALHYFIPLTIPAGVYGIIILYLLLYFKIIKLQDVKPTGEFLIDILPIILIPSAVSLLNYFELLKVKALGYILTAIVSTVIVMFTAGKITDIIILKELKNENKNKSGKKAKTKTKVKI